MRVEGNRKGEGRRWIRGAAGDRGKPRSSTCSRTECLGSSLLLQPSSTSVVTTTAQMWPGMFTCTRTKAIPVIHLYLQNTQAAMLTLPFRNVSFCHACFCDHGAVPLQQQQEIGGSCSGTWWRRTSSSTADMASAPLVSTHSDSRWMLVKYSSSALLNASGSGHVCAGAVFSSHIVRRLHAVHC